MVSVTAELLSGPLLRPTAKTLFELEHATTYNLTVDLDVYLLGAQSESTRAQIVDVLTAVDSEV